MWGPLPPCVPFFFSLHLLLICFDHGCIKARTCFLGLHIDYVFMCPHLQRSLLSVNRKTSSNKILIVDFHKFLPLKSQRGSVSVLIKTAETAAVNQSCRMER